jgi:succinate-semialdehyde dehydrogenase / glutarate-semialdehyde dehydrogenase
MNAEQLPLRNPRTGVIEGHFSAATADDVTTTVARLRAAQGAWRGAGVQARADTLRAWLPQLQARREAIVAALSVDTGRWAEAELEFNAVCSSIERWCTQAPALLAEEPARQAAIPFIRIEPQRWPHPVVGIISPWNWPLLLALIDAVPALLAGCAVLIKPSEVTPRFVAPFMASIAAVPELAAVWHTVLGGAATGQAMVQAVDAICFTGSVRTGRHVGQAAMEAFIPCFLELGGKDPAIVLADADVDRAARSLAWGGMVGAGQSCMSIERVYVEEPVASEFEKRLVSHVKQLQLNWPDIRQGQIGPIIAAPQIDIVRRHLADALARGARALCGGKVVDHDGGSWCEPTVLVDVTPDMLVMHEETFAAILPVMRCATVDAAVTQANSGAYGLSAAVFGRDMAQARAIAQRLQAGAVSINDSSLTAMVHDAAKQSFKFSGLGGSRMGLASMARFYRQQALLINEANVSPWWFTT